MLTVGKAALVMAGVASAGILLGVLAGDAANPTMKPPPESRWRGAVAGPEAPYRSNERAPEPVPFRGFAPGTDAGIAADWPEFTRGWDESFAYDAYPVPDPAAGYVDPFRADNEPIPPRSAAERAADEAQRAAEDAAIAATDTPSPEPRNADGLPALW